MPDWCSIDQFIWESQDERQIMLDPLPQGGQPQGHCHAFGNILVLIPGNYGHQWLLCVFVQVKRTSWILFGKERVFSFESIEGSGKC